VTSLIGISLALLAAWLIGRWQVNSRWEREIKDRIDALEMHRYSFEAKAKQHERMLRGSLGASPPRAVNRAKPNAVPTGNCGGNANDGQGG